MILNGVESGNINVEDWKKGTQYREPYKEDHKVVKWFWNLVELMNPREKGRLLKFVTGSENLPVLGFKYDWCKLGIWKPTEARLPAL